jgi:CBS domain-containing protein
MPSPAPQKPLPNPLANRETSEDAIDLSALHGALQDDLPDLLSNSIQVSKLMSRTFSVVRPDCAAGEIRKQMLENKFRHIVVCDLQGRLLGIISDRDLKRPGQTAADLMTANPCVVSPDTKISSAISILVNRGISCLPVVDDQGCVTGLLNTEGLMAGLVCSLPMLERIADLLSFEKLEKGGRSLRETL